MVKIMVTRAPMTEHYTKNEQMADTDHQSGLSCLHG